MNNACIRRPGCRSLSGTRVTGCRAMVARWPDCLALARCRLGEAPRGAGPMTVISVVHDQQAHTLTLTAQYAAPVEDVWQLWPTRGSWSAGGGRPTYPATVLDHDLSVGGRVRSVMTGPKGDQQAGWWRIAAVAAPTGLEFDDGFGDPDAPSPSLPVSRTRVTSSDGGGGVTRMVLATSFPSAEAMDQLSAMGMREGLTAAVGQTDDLLAGAPQR